MFGHISKGFQLMAVTESWSEQALKDGKVTLKEATDLAVRLCEILDIPLEIEVPKGTTEED